jgi:uncharacterized membrane protein
MNSLYLPFALTVGGMLVYHLSQKSIPSGINPFFATILAYLVGIIVCFIFAFTYPGNKSFSSAVKESNWAVFAMGAGAAAIEVGFMLAYRNGWKISITAITTNVAVAVMLIPIGLLLFKEHLSMRNILGLVFCILGLFLAVKE